MKLSSALTSVVWKIMLSFIQLSEAYPIVLVFKENIFLLVIDWILLVNFLSSFLIAFLWEYYYFEHSSGA